MKCCRIMCMNITERTALSHFRLKKISAERNSLKKAVYCAPLAGGVISRVGLNV